MTQQVETFTYYSKSDCLWCVLSQGVFENARKYSVVHLLKRNMTYS
jgi:hypothetical protein